MSMNISTEFQLSVSQWLLEVAVELIISLKSKAKSVAIAFNL
jgi:hypothetical protein